MKTDLKSSVADKGKAVSQVIHFLDGDVRTFHNIDTSSIEQNQCTMMNILNGQQLEVHTKRVKFILVVPESPTKSEGETMTKIFHFKDNSKETIHGIIVGSEKTGEFRKFQLQNGSMLMVHFENVNLVENFEQKNGWREALIRCAEE